MSSVKGKSPGRCRGSDSWQNHEITIPHPLAFSSQNGARAEIYRLALASLTADEFVEWLSGFGCGDSNRREAA
jgi:hypothetical protein